MKCYGVIDVVVEVSLDLVCMISLCYMECFGVLIDDVLVWGVILLVGGCYDSVVCYVVFMLLIDVFDEVCIGFEEIFGLVLFIEVFDVID